MLSDVRGIAVSALVGLAVAAGASHAHADEPLGVRPASPIETGSVERTGGIDPVAIPEGLGAPPKVGEDGPSLKARRWILRQLLGGKEAGSQVGARPAKGALVEPGPRVNQHAPPVLVADADPDFKLWQQRANERLKQEEERYGNRANKLAAEKPDSFVVVCEAGCRSSDHIVYMVLKSAAAKAGPPPQPPRVLEPASGEAPKEATAGMENGGETIEAVSCLAGCRDDASQKKAGSSPEKKDEPVRSGGTAGVSPAQDKASDAGEHAAAPSAAPVRAGKLKVTSARFAKRKPKLAQHHTKAVHAVPGEPAKTEVRAAQGKTHKKHVRSKPASRRHASGTPH